VLRQYKWVDRIAVYNYRFSVVEPIADNTKEIFDEFEHKDKIFRQGDGKHQHEILNLGLDLFKYFDIVFISDADELIHPDDQKEIMNCMLGKDSGYIHCNIVDYNGDLYHASPKRPYYTLVAVDPNKTRFTSIRSIGKNNGILDCNATIHHLGLVFTPEIIDWKSNWEYKAEGHGRDKLLADWKVTREVTPPQWLVDLLK